MEVVGEVAELWRYPVKSMGGESCDTLSIGEHGVDGDRRYAFESIDAPAGKPLLRAAQRAAMLRFQAVTTADGAVLVCSPAGHRLPVASPELAEALRAASGSTAPLHLRHEPIPFTDVRPVALHSLATIHALGQEHGAPFDARRFRSNIVLRLSSARPFAENSLPGHILRLGDRLELRITERIPRCTIVSLQPLTAARDSALLRHLAMQHGGRVGIYARPRTAGAVRVGDPVTLLE